jgi:hypothetical protein
MQLADLGTDVNGQSTSEAFDINDSGVAVGFALKHVGGIGFGNRAVAWQSDGAAIDLNSLIDPSSGWVLHRARGISETGWITGLGSFDPDGLGNTASYLRHFLIRVPEFGVPEPSALMLFVSGIIGVLSCHRQVLVARCCPPNRRNCGN